MQTIWITGGSSGIGFSTAKKFLENKWQVIISSGNLEKLQYDGSWLSDEQNSIPNNEWNNIIIDYYLVIGIINEYQINIYKVLFWIQMKNTGGY